MSIPRPSRGGWWWLATFGALALFPQQGAAQARLAVRNLAPSRLIFVQPPIEGVAVNGRGVHTVGLDLAYASVYTTDRSGENSAVFDMEVFRMGLRYRYGLAVDTEVGIEMPFLWMGAGIFDSFLNDFHDTLHLPSGNRKDAPTNEFQYEVETGGKTYAPSPGGGLAPGDLTLYMKRQLGSLAAVDLAARWLVELPTGDSDDGFGNGAVDTSLGLLAGGRWGPVDLFGTLDFLYLGGSPDPAMDLSTHWSLAAGGGLAFPVWSLGKAEASIAYAMSPYDARLDSLDRDAAMLAVSFGRRDAGLDWSVGFTEDLAPEASPDFSVFITLDWSWPKDDEKTGRTSEL